MGQEVRGLLLLSTLALDGCSNAEEKSAKALAVIVARYREAPMDQKESAASALEGFACGSFATVCKAQRACLDSALPTKRALQTKRTIEEALAKGALSTREQAGLHARIDAAEADLVRGRDALELCAAEMAILQTRIGGF
jgi:hypothetical protein